jgi:hypothetical protein
MSVLSHIRVTHGIAIRATETGESDQSRGESRWKQHLRQIADSPFRGQAQGWRRGAGASVNSTLGR